MGRAKPAQDVRFKPIGPPRTGIRRRHRSARGRGMSRRGGPGTGGSGGRLRRWPFPCIAFLISFSVLSPSLASNGTEATATSIVSSAASVPPACLVRLAARDGADRTLFESVAAATATPGLAVAPLHPLER